jgi:pilus biogenesis lipoprotein CpaD
MTPRFPISRRSTRLVLIAGLSALALTACDRTTNTYFPPRHGYLEITPRNEVSLATSQHRLDLDRVQTRLNRTQIDRLNVFLAGLGEEEGDHIEIRTALTGGPQRNAAIADDLRRSFVSGGYAPSRVRVIEVPQMRDTVEVVLLRYTVVLPDCSHEVSRLSGIQGWSDEPVGERALGCNNERNLGLMIADPRDLSGDRELAPSPGYRESDAVQRYRLDKIKEIERNQTSKAK